MYIWVTAASPCLAWQPLAPRGGIDEKSTAVPPEPRETSLGSSGPVTIRLISVLFFLIYSSATQRCAQGCPAEVRRADHVVTFASKGASPVLGHRAHAEASKGALPSMISEYQVWSMMVQPLAPWAAQLPSSTRCSLSSRWRRAATRTWPSFTNRDGFMSTPPLLSAAVSGSLTSIMRPSWRIRAGSSERRASLGSSNSRPPNTNDKMTGMPHRALGCLAHHRCTGLWTVCTVKTAVPSRKARKKKRLMSFCLGQTL
mmetsp:Transcript_55021/g.170433  ORF Transcript_55021/g.170433 Transcript_55021/m.170433 type:complete len:257 (+) Transcript_55021:599-1369(+)